MALRPAEHKASWENYQAQSDVALQYGQDGETTPQYYSVYARLPNLYPILYGHAKGKRDLVRVSFKALLQIQAGTVVYAGFMGAQLGYRGGVPNLPFNWMANFPILDTYYPTIDAVDYDPTALPVGGVTYPIWQKKSIDFLVADHYISDDEGPAGAALNGVVYVQLFCNAATNPAVNVRLFMKYEIKE